MSYDYIIVFKDLEFWSLLTDFYIAVFGILTWLTSLTTVLEMKWSLHISLLLLNLQRYFLFLFSESKGFSEITNLPEALLCVPGDNDTKSNCANLSQQLTSFHIPDQIANLTPGRCVCIMNGPLGKRLQCSGEMSIALLSDSVYFIHVYKRIVFL